MTYVPASGSSRNAAARIRILGCDQPPPPKRAANRSIVAACAIAVVLGVGISLAVRAVYPQNAQAPSAQPVVAANIELMGQASGGARLTNRRTHSVMVSAVNADMSSAAHYARSHARPAVTVSGNPPADSAVAPAPVAIQNPTADPVTTGTAPQPTTPKATGPIGPEAPQNPTNPNSQIDAS